MATMPRLLAAQAAGVQVGLVAELLDRLQHAFACLLADGDRVGGAAETRETVLCETLASLATSRMVTGVVRCGRLLTVIGKKRSLLKRFNSGSKKHAPAAHWIISDN